MDFKVKINRRNNSDKVLLKDLQKIVKKLSKKSITRNEYDKNGTFSSTTIENRFGTWTNALLKAGLEINQNRNISKEKLFENIAEVWMRIGRQPTYNDFTKDVSKYSIKPYERNFGSWNKALIAFSEYINSRKNLNISNMSDKNKGSLIAGHNKGPRTVNYRLRFIVMKGDNFRCRICGKSPANDNNIILHVDHIKPWSKGGETCLDNLRTLCSICNIGKSDIH